MRNISFLSYSAVLASVLLATTPLRAADPVVVAAAPAVAPAPVTSQRILILPFGKLTAAPDKAWIAAAVQQNLMTDLGRVPGLTAVPYTLDVTIPSTSVAARLGDQSGAQYAVMGAMQAVDLQVRLTAQVVDVKTSDIIGTAKVTGLQSDLLKLEDQLSEEVRKVIRGEKAVAQAAANVSVAGAANPAAATPVIVIVQPPQAPVAPAMPAIDPNAYGYNYPYVSPYSYGYGGYGGYGLPFIIPSYTGFNGNSGFRGRGFHHGIGPSFPVTVTSTTYASASLGLGSVLPTGNMISVYGSTPSPFVSSPGVTVTKH